MAMEKNRLGVAPCGGGWFPGPDRMKLVRETLENGPESGLRN
jgi:hypothetical protein